MAFEVILGEDCRFVLSHLKQSAYGTRLVDGNFDSGKSLRLNVATLGEITKTRAQEGPRPMTGHEFNTGEEREIIRDSGISIAMPCNSMMIGWTAAFLLGQATSVQEGATTHYTHTSRPTNPIASGQSRQPPVTSFYLDSNGPDATRLRRVLHDLAVSGFTVSFGNADIMQLVIDCLGSGKEVTNPTITIPALTSVQDFASPDMKTEYGAKGGALTDISERIREGSIRCTQELAAAEGYYPGSGKFRGRIWFVRRTFAVDLAIWANRANRDFIDDMINDTRKELKFTADSGVLAGTGTVNHKFVVRFPDCRITESPLPFENAGAIYGVRIAENQIYKDAAVADSPVTITTDNVQASYLT